MTITAVNFLTETSSAAVNVARGEIYAAYGFGTMAGKDRGVVLGDLNTMLPATDQITASQRWSRSKEIYDLLNDPDALLTAYLALYPGIVAGKLSAASGRLWQDVAGTTPVAAFGDPVGRVDFLPGSLVSHMAVTDTANRPAYARRPRGGLRNRANGSAAVSNTAFWPATVVSNGITSTVIGTGIEDGLDYVDVQYAGTATSTFHSSAYAIANSRTRAVVGQNWTASLIARRIAGTTPASGGLRVGAAEETAPSTFVGTTDSELVTADTDTTASTTRTIVSGNQIRTGIILTVQNGATIDVTYRIKGLQLELGSARTANQRNLAAFDITEAGQPDALGLLFDGVNDFFITPTITWATDRVQVFAGVDKRTDAARATVLEHTPAGNGRFSLDAPGGGATERFTFRVGGSASVNIHATDAGFTAPVSALLEGQADISEDSAIFRVNGADVATSAGDQGTGNFATAALYVGARSGTSQFFPGFMGGFAAFNVHLPSGPANAVRRAIANPMGVTLT